MQITLLLLLYKEPTTSRVYRFVSEVTLIKTTPLQISYPMLFKFKALYYAEMRYEFGSAGHVYQFSRSNCETTKIQVSEVKTPNKLRLLKFCDKIKLFRVVYSMSVHFPQSFNSLFHAFHS